MRRHAMLKPGGIDDYRLCTSIKNIFKIFYFGPKSTPTQPLIVSKTRLSELKLWGIGHLAKCF